jgi:hypothetical protein
MTGGLPDPPLLGWRADLDLASPTRGLSHLDQAHFGLQKSVIGQPANAGGNRRTGGSVRFPAGPRRVGSR